MQNIPAKLWLHAAVALALLPTAAHAQSSSYQVGELTPPGAASLTDATQGPIRLARFSDVQGNVTWRTGDNAAWSPASVNLPIRQGAQIWVTGGGRAEIQFDDGALLRLGTGAVVTLQTLYSDADGEFTEVEMDEGLAALKLAHDHSVYQVDTPFAAVKSVGPSRVRIGVGSEVEVAVRSGSAGVQGTGGQATLHGGDYLHLGSADDTYNIGTLPNADSWDAWNDARDRQLADADSVRRLPPNIALVAGDLDEYGGWRDDPRYGAVWVPRVDETGWRPYEHGRWTWVEPFGWTWVSSEDWGWAPYHYGAWVDEPYGWAWVPGPARQYWCPAVVHFSEYDGGVAWAPLAPVEVHYPPALSLGFRSGNWSLFFSIGGAAVYYPSGPHRCDPRPFNNVVVNKTVYVSNVSDVYDLHRTININNVNNGVYTRTVNRNVTVNNFHFLPVNAQNANGVTSASLRAFGTGGAYTPQTQARAGLALFAQGRSVGAPPPGSPPVAGPAARPTALALTSSRSLLAPSRPAPAVLQRPIFRAPLPERVARAAPPLRQSVPVSPAPPFVARRRPAGASASFATSAGAPPVAAPARRPAFAPDASPNTAAGIVSPRDRARRAALAARESLVVRPAAPASGALAPTRRPANETRPAAPIRRPEIFRLPAPDARPQVMERPAPARQPDASHRSPEGPPLEGRPSAPRQEAPAARPATAPREKIKAETRPKSDTMQPKAARK